MEKEAAYKEAIKHFGNTNTEVVYNSNKETLNVWWVEIIYICSLVIGGLAICLDFINEIAAVCVLAVSMIAYGVAYALTMQKCNKYKNEDYDIAKYRMELRNAFKYLKIAMIIWMVTPALIISRILAGIVLLVANGSLFLPMGAIFGLAPLYIVLFFVVYVVAFAASLYLSFIFGRKLLAKTMAYYERESGSDEFSVKIPEKKPKKKSTFNKEKLIPVLSILGIVIVTYDVFEGLKLLHSIGCVYGYSNSNLDYIGFVTSVLVTMEIVIGVIVFLIFILFIALKKKKASRILVSSYICVDTLFFFLTYFILDVIYGEVYDFGKLYRTYIQGYIVLMTVLVLSVAVTIFLLARNIKREKEAKLNNNMNAEINA